MNESTILEYSKWLAKVTDLTDGSTSDLVSRTKRISALIKITAQSDNEKLDLDVSNVEEFKNKKKWTFSQHRKAAKMYRDFLLSKYKSNS